MPNYSNRSKSRLMTCHPSIIVIMNEVIKTFDVTILCGWRGEVDQNRAYPKYSKVKYPDSKHNHILDDKPTSLAIDCIPYDSNKGSIVSWSDSESFALMAGYILCTAEKLNIPLRWGHDWNKNYLLSDEFGKLVDRPHFELIGRI